MRGAFSAIWDALSLALGAAVFIAIMWWAATVQSRMWRLVSARYQRRERAPVIARKLETIVITRRGPLGPIIAGNANCQRYSGVVIAVTRQGLTFSAIPIPPYNVACPALMLPFDEMVLERTVWGLWPDPYALRMNSLPDIDIIVGRDTVRWIRSQTDQRPFGWDV